MKETTENWYLRLFRKSILKQQKLRAILGYLPSCASKTCADLGGDNGVISFFLRKQGGEWHSLDLDDKAVELIRSVVGDNAYKIQDARMPFSKDYFNTAVIIDILEHLSDDKKLVLELARTIKPGGNLLANVPFRKKISLIRPIKNMLGLTDEKHGHLRPGYTKKELKKLLEPEFSIKRQKTYSRFFTEIIDIAINLSQKQDSSGSKGTLLSEEDLKKKQRMFRIYSFIYPFLWLFSKLDLFLFFTRGNMLIVYAEKAYNL